MLETLHYTSDRFQVPQSQLQKCNIANNGIFQIVKKGGNFLIRNLETKAVEYNIIFSCVSPTISNEILVNHQLLLTNKAAFKFYLKQN